MRVHHRFIRHLVCATTSMTLIVMLASSACAASLPTELNVDYGYFNPISLIVRKFNWLEKEFKPDNIPVHWVQTNSSRYSIECLNRNELSVGSTGIISALIGRSAGSRIKAVYIVTRFDLGSFLIAHDSPCKSLSELKGKKIAVPPGTDTYIFMLRALREHGLSTNDIKIVPLTPAEGQAALENHNVDAWFGLEPYASLSQLENGSRILYRSSTFNSFGTLTVTEEFMHRYPEAIRRVIKVYERARRWAIQHPDDFEQMYREQTGLPLQVIRLVISKLDFYNPVIDRNDLVSMKNGCALLREEKLVDPATDFDAVITGLVDRKLASEVLFNTGSPEK